MKNTEILLGPPGTGKTTRLLNLVESYLAKGISPEKIGFISFTKKAVTEARDRAAERFKLPVDSFLYFRTIHSFSFRSLGMTSGQVMQRSHYQELGNIMGMKISGIHRQDQEVYEMSRGDQLVFIESLSRLTCKTITETWQELNSDLDFHELELFQKSLIKYKTANLLYDFTDMLVKFLTEGYKPDLEVLFVDEAQDLCALQWRLVEQLSERSGKTYIAGDDDQAIFRWSGADVDHFLKLSNELPSTVLEQSYRVPVSVHSFSGKLSSQIVLRTKKEYKPRPEQGKVEFVSTVEDIDMDKGNWLLLVRNGFLIKDLVEHLRSCGYSYCTNYYSLSDDSAIQAAVIWEKLRAGRKVTIPEAKKVLSFMGTGKGVKSLQGKAKEDTIDHAQLILGGFMNPSVSGKIWHEALDKIPADDLAYYSAVKRRGENLTKKARIKVSTIHGAKGGEEDNVVLFTDMSAKTHNYMLENFDDELRVFYVGATRAKQNLFIVQPQTNNFFPV